MPESVELVPLAEDLSALSLERLTELVNAEVAEVDRAEAEAIAVLSAGLVHAIRAGELMEAARDRVMESGRSWQAFVEENFDCSYHTVQHYIRFWRYREVLVESSTPLTVFNAHRHLRGLPSAQKRLDEAEVMRLFNAGMNCNEIASQLGASHSSIRCITDPEYRQRKKAQLNTYRRQQRAAKKALEAEERRAEVQSLARSAGGSLAKAWASVVRLSGEIDRAQAEAEDRETKLALVVAQRKLIAVEAEIQRALRTT